MITLENTEMMEGDDKISPPFIKIVSGRYAGVHIYLGSVSFPDPDQPRLSFNYDIIEGEGNIGDRETFHQALGDFVVLLLESRLADGTLIYKGGDT